MGESVISVELIGADRVLEQLKGLANPEAVMAALEAISNRIVEIAQVYVDTPGGPVIDPGRNEHLLRDSIRVAFLQATSEGGEALITSGGGGEAPGLAVWLEYGTGVYGEMGRPIVPLTAGMMHWQWSWGDWAKAHLVAGQPPRRYMHRVIEEHMEELLAIFVDSLQGSLGAAKE